MMCMTAFHRYSPVYRNVEVMIGATTIGLGSETSFSSASSSSSSCENDDQALSGAFYLNAPGKAIISDDGSIKPESPPPSGNTNSENPPLEGPRLVAARILRRPRVASTRASEGVDPSVAASVVGKKRVRRETLPDIAKRIPVDALRPYLNMSLVSAAKVFMHYSYWRNDCIGYCRDFFLLLLLGVDLLIMESCIGVLVWFVY